VSVENKGDSVVVTDETAALGKRSLKVTDAPGLKRTWKPHLYWRMNRDKGTMVTAFDIRVERESKVDFEWRDWSGDPYKIGARVAIHNGKLRVSDGRTMDIPFDRWVRIVIEGGLGSKADGTFSVTATVQGRSGGRTFPNVKYVTGGFKRVTWLGFMSNATVKTSFYLDNIHMDAK